jgi:hypothetical protein
MQVFVGITLVLLTLGVARLRAKHRSVGLQAWSLAVAIVGGHAFNRLDDGGLVDGLVSVTYALLATLTIAALARSDTAAAGARRSREAEQAESRTPRRGR